uniref:acyltransferase family protein n=1 Tax=Vreelandella lionensis TaxID=1144478 RepID=UPI0009F54175
APASRIQVILFVCLVHIPYIAGFSAETTTLGTTQTLFSVYLKDVIARGAVPLLTIISGYLAYHSFKKYSYKDFVVKKTNALLLPFFVFNIALFLTLHVTLLSTGVNLGNVAAASQSMGDLISAILGYNRLPINPPLYFLRDLFIISLFTPLIHFIVKRPYLFALFILVLLHINFTSIGIYASILDTKVGVLYRSDMLLFYTVGYFFSQRQWSIPKPSNFTTLLSLKFYIFITLCICVLIVAVKPSMFAYFKYRLVIGALTLSFIPFIISGFLFIKDTWGAKLLLKFSKYSFTLFLTHICFVHLFTTVKRAAGFTINNQSDLFLQAGYFSAYLLGCMALAIVAERFGGLPRPRPGS